MGYFIFSLLLLYSTSQSLLFFLRLFDVLVLNIDFKYVFQKLNLPDADFDLEPDFFFFLLSLGILLDLDLPNFSFDLDLDFLCLCFLSLFLSLSLLLLLLLLFLWNINFKNLRRHTLIFFYPYCYSLYRITNMILIMIIYLLSSSLNV